MQWLHPSQVPWWRRQSVQEKQVRVMAELGSGWGPTGSVRPEGLDTTPAQQACACTLRDSGGTYSVLLKHSGTKEFPNKVRDPKK